MPNRFFQLPFVLVLLLLGFAAGDTPAQSPFARDAVQLDWVCVTDGALAEAYAPLAAHRESQGLASVVLALDEVIRWSPAGDDTTATLRWLSTVAVNQWGAQYLLLGGSHTLLPSPIHRLQAPYHDYDHPIDTYYSCLDGDWDVDGDGFFAEAYDDAADPTVHIALGRIPADDSSSVNNVVAKILAFEQRPVETTQGALFVSSLMDPNWEPPGPYPNPYLGFAMSLQDSVMAMRPDLRVGSLFQGNEEIHPELDPLNRMALEDSLAARPHDLVFIQLNGTDHAWELVSHLTVGPEDFEELAGCGHGFLLTMVSGPVSDTRDYCLLQDLLTLPAGGPVAAIAPTGMGFLSPMYDFQMELWPNLVNPETRRLGDAHLVAMTAVVEEYYFSSPFASTYWVQSVMGDPATLLQTTADPVVDVPRVSAVGRVRAIPNPFNPATAIHFEVPGASGQAQPVKVEIFNLQGRRLATLLNESLPSGSHSVSWGDGIISGLYFARVTVAGRAQSVKLTLVE